MRHRTQPKGETMKRTRFAAVALMLAISALGFTAARADNDGLDIYTYPPPIHIKPLKLPTLDWEQSVWVNVRPSIRSGVEWIRERVIGLASSPCGSVNKD